MIFLLSALPFIFIARALERRLDRSYAETFPVTVMGAIALMYLCGLAGILKASLLMIYVLGASAAVYCVCDRLKGRGRVGVSPAFLLILVAVPCSVVFTHGRLLTIWDEFSHWGTVVKNMVCFDALGTCPGSTVLYRSYPPALSLLQYYFVRFEPAFLESSLFSAKDVLSFALLLPFMKKTEWTRWPQAVLLGAIALLLPFVEYFYYYRTIIVDGLLALLMGNIIISYMDAQKHDWLDMLRVCLPVFTLTLVKTSGVGLAALTLLILGADYLVTGRKRVSGGSLKRWLWALLPLLSLLMAKLSWDVHMRLTATGDFWNTSSSVTLESLIGLTQGMEQYQKEVFVAFFDQLFSLSADSYYLIGMSPALWLSFLILPAALIFALKPEKPRRRRVLVMTVSLIMGAFVWLASMLAMYLFIMVPAEAPGLASFNRYFSTYQLGAFMVAIWMLIDAWGVYQPHKLTLRLVLLCCGLFALFSCKDVLYATVASPLWNADTREDRQAAYAHGASFGDFMDPETDRVAVISQESMEDGGMDYYVTRFQAAPIDVTVAGSWSIGRPYHSKDIWSVDMEPEQWAQALLESGATYLYLYHIDDVFIDRYGVLFPQGQELESDTLYRVEVSGGGLTLTLVPWE